MIRPVAVRMRLGVLLAALLLVSPLLVSGQEPAQAKDQLLFLPMLGRIPETSIEFAAEINRETREPINPTSTFSQGLDLMYVTWRLRALQGRQYRVDFTFPDGETLTGQTFTVPTDDHRSWSRYCLVARPPGTCSDARAQMAPGTYTTRVYVDDVPFLEAQAVIQ